MERTCILLAFVALLVAPFATTEAANILCVCTTPSPSHIIVHMTYARLLADRGHNVTVITRVPIKNKELYNHILIPLDEAEIDETNRTKTEMFRAKSKFESMKLTINFLLTIAPVQSKVMRDKRFQDFLHNPGNKFDLVILGYFMNDFLVGLGEHYNCPIIVSWMSAANLLLNKLIGNPMEVAYASSNDPPDPFTFKGRLINFGTMVTMEVFNFIIGNSNKELYSEFFPPSKYRSIEEAKNRISLLFVNAHFTEGAIRPNVPAHIEVGGIQIKDKPHPLPDDIQKIFNASQEHGVIYFSLGSVIGSDQLDPKALKIIFDGLVGFKQTILWKYEDSNFPGTAPNIHYRKWLPQDDILAQPNTRLFITHAGKGSVAESQYHGVPMVAIPFFADQYGHAQAVEKEGFGLAVDKNAMTAESFRNTVLKVLNDATYRENVKRFSALYRDRPMTARETATFWLEYVLRHKGAYHMESPLRHLSAWQAASVDVIAFLLLVIYLIYRAIRFAGTFALRKILRRSSTKQKVS